jgi:Metallo-beta-lactamase superfamily
MPSDSPTGPERMTAFICETCGVQHAPSTQPPASCAICGDERQYVGWSGQRWTTLERLRRGHEPDIREEEPALLGIGMKPSFAIDQRALLVQTPDGNVLWDCTPLIGEEIVAELTRRGGLSAIAISHPHYYSTMAEWSETFDAPVYVHAADGEWVMRPSPRLVLWEGEVCELLPGLALLRLGGHFAGGTVLNWPGGAGGRGALLSGDIVQVVEDRRWVSFMRSYPNLIPLPADEVRRIALALRPYRFERIYGAWYGRMVAEDGNAVVERSADRYVRALAGEFGA